MADLEIVIPSLIRLVRETRVHKSNRRHASSGCLQMSVAVTFAATLIGYSSVAVAGLSKHYYCVVRHEGLGPRCQTCWSYVGGEGGRAGCGYLYGPGTVHFGSCEESRNRPPC